MGLWNSSDSLRQTFMLPSEVPVSMALYCLTVIPRYFATSLCVKSAFFRSVFRLFLNTTLSFVIYGIFNSIFYV